MANKEKHSVRFKHTDADIFEDVDMNKIENILDNKLPDDLIVERSYCEYPKPYGHKPYIVIIIDNNTFIRQSESTEETKDKIINIAENIVGEDVVNHKVEGWS